MATVAKSTIRRQRCRTMERASFTRSGTVLRSGPSTPVDRIQRTAGNVVAARWLRSHVIQPKMNIGRADDRYEREADRIADQILRLSDKRTAPSFRNAPLNISRSCGECEKERTVREE